MYKVYGWKLTGSLATEAALAEAGADYEIVPVNIKEGEQHRNEYGRINPRRQVPAFRRQIGVVFQDHKLLNDRSVFDNVALPLIIGGMGRKELGKRVRAALDQVNLLQYEKQLPATLSTGEQQRAKMCFRASAMLEVEK